MKNVTSKPELSHPAIESNSHLFDDWFDPIENMIRGQVRGLIEEMIRGELGATLSRPRYRRRSGHSEGRDLTTAVVTGHRHGSRGRTLTGTTRPAERFRRQDDGMEPTNSDPANTYGFPTLRRFRAAVAT
jgi:putative transposase